MRVNGQPDILRIRAHLDGKRGLGDQVAADGPTMLQPMIRSVVSSNRTLVRPSSRPSERERPLAAQGNTLPYRDPLRLGLVLGQPTQATSGSV